MMCIFQISSGRCIVCRFSNVPRSKVLRSETWIFIFHLIDSLSLHLHFKFKESKSNAGGKIVSVVVGSGVTTWHGVTATVAACNCGRAVVIARLRG